MKELHVFPQPESSTILARLICAKPDALRIKSQSQSAGVVRFER